MSCGRNNNSVSTEWSVSPCVWLLPSLVARVSVLYHCVKGILAVESTLMYEQSGEAISYLMFLIIFDSLVELRLFLPKQITDEPMQSKNARSLLQSLRRWDLIAIAAAVFAILPRLARIFNVSMYPNEVSKMALAACVVLTVLGSRFLIRLFLLAKR